MISKALKAEYDREYRAKNRAAIKAKKAAYFQRVYTPAKGRAWRAERNRRQPGHHTEYCRRYMADPARKAAKVSYDERRRGEKLYPGHPEWAVCHRLTIELMNEIRKRQRWYERARERGYYERTNQVRKRDAQISRW